MLTPSELHDFTTQKLRNPRFLQTYVTFLSILQYTWLRKCHDYRKRKLVGLYVSAALKFKGLWSYLYLFHNDFGATSRKDGGSNPN
jgi:hypothetical protein